MSLVVDDRGPLVADAVGSELTALEQIIRTRDVRAVYQPIVDLHSAQTVGWEALARGPAGSPLETPDRLFEAAGRHGLTAELDHCCQLAAIEGALSAGLGTAQELFINVEPAGVDAAAPAFLRRAWDHAQSQLRTTFEITERALTSAPAELLGLVTE